MKQATLIFFLTLLGGVSAQFSESLPEKGVLPFSGARFFRHGLGGEGIEVVLDGDTWTSNKLPIDKDFEVELLRPKGLKAAEDGNYYPGIEVLISNTKKDTLGYIANIFGEESEGFDAEMLKSLTLTLGFNQMSKPGDTCLLRIKFYDTNSDNFLLVDFPVIIADPALPLDVTNSTFSVSATDGYEGIASGVDIRKAETELKNNDFEVRLMELDISEKDFRAGTLQVWLYDANLNPVLSERKSFSMKGSGEVTNLSVKIVLETNTAFARFRWESKDRSKVIDFVGKTY